MAHWELEKEVNCYAVGPEFNYLAKWSGASFFLIQLPTQTEEESLEIIDELNNTEPDLEFYKRKAKLAERYFDMTASIHGYSAWADVGRARWIRDYKDLHEKQAEIERRRLEAELPVWPEGWWPL